MAEILLFAFTSDPCLINNWTTSKFPPFAAKWSAVIPSESKVTSSTLWQRVWRKSYPFLSLPPHAQPKTGQCQGSHLPLHNAVQYFLSNLRWHLQRYDKEYGGNLTLFFHIRPMLNQKLDNVKVPTFRCIMQCSHFIYIYSGIFNLVIKSMAEILPFSFTSAPCSTKN